MKWGIELVKHGIRDCIHYIPVVKISFFEDLINLIKVNQKSTKIEEKTRKKNNLNKLFQNKIENLKHKRNGYVDIMGSVGWLGLYYNNARVMR